MDKDAVQCVLLPSASCQTATYSKFLVKCHHKIYSLWHTFASLVFISAPSRDKARGFIVREGFMRQGLRRDAYAPLQYGGLEL